MKNNKHMNKQFYFKRSPSVILISLILLLSLFSCSREVSYSDDSATRSCQYQGQNYIPRNPNNSCWDVYATSDQVEYIDTTPVFLWGGGMLSYRPIFATKENPANFLVISYSYDKSEFYSSYTLIRDDLNLESELDTAFSSITVQYYNINDAEQKDVRFENIPDGVSFDDLIDHNIESTEIKPADSKLYCTLYCSHPEIQYLQCRFDIYVSNGEYYLEVDLTSDDPLYYSCNPQVAWTQ